MLTMMVLVWEHIFVKAILLITSIFDTLYSLKVFSVFENCQSSYSKNTMISLEYVWAVKC